VAVPHDHLGGRLVPSRRHAWDDDDRAVYATIGRRLLAARHRAGLTQLALAGYVGLSRGSIANIEAGGQGMGIPLFLSLADALNVDPADLLTGDG